MRLAKKEDTMKALHEDAFRPGPLSRLLWAWKALPATTRRKRLADALWFWLHGDEAAADAVLR